METEGVRVLERRIESFFTPWAWQWNVGETPEFGRYLGTKVFDLVILSYLLLSQGSRYIHSKNSSLVLLLITFHMYPTHQL